MIFNLDGRQYRLKFKREVRMERMKWSLWLKAASMDEMGLPRLDHYEATQMAQLLGPLVKPPKVPVMYTSVFLLDDKGTVVNEAMAWTHPADVRNHRVEAGRQAAVKKLVKGMDKLPAATVLKAYFERSRAKTPEAAPEAAPVPMQHH